MQKRRKRRAAELLVLEACDRRGLPGDVSKDSTPRYTPGTVFCTCDPTPLASPVLIACDDIALALIGLNAETEGLAQLVSGNELPAGCEPAAFAYAGHQFGSFAGQLGDGAAVSLGSVKTACGILELQLKGCGRTPYTRDNLSGRKYLASLVHEFEMMQALRSDSIPTAIPIALVADKTTGEAVLMRASASFFRFGTFELCNQRAPNGKAGPSVGDYELLKRLVDYAIDRLYPHLHDMDVSGEEERYMMFVVEVTQRTARLAASWQVAGWVHGTLNSDNMSIAGETLDHGIGRYMGAFFRHWVCNPVDRSGLYSYERQPDACLANCQRLAEALQPLHAERMQDAWRTVETTFWATFRQDYVAGMLKQLNLSPVPGGEDEAMISELIDCIEELSLEWRPTLSALGGKAGHGDLPPAGLEDWAAKLEMLRKRRGSF